VLPWAALTRVDEVGTAKGRLEPRGKTMRLDAAIAGAVAKVNVKEGQTVRAGDRLVELNADLIRNQQLQAQTKLESQLNRLAQLQAMGRQLEVSRQTQRLQVQAQLNEQLAERDRTTSRLNYYETAQDLTRQVLKQDRTRATRFREFHRVGIITGVQAEDAERVALETQQRVSQIGSDRAQAQAELQKQASTSERIRREGEVTLLASGRQQQEAQAELAQLRTDIEQTRHQIAALNLQLKQTVITVPIAGTIFQLPVQRPGAVVQPGEQIATIAPLGTPLILRAKLTSRESGFVKVGLPVKIKFDAYPFQDYGIITGKVRWIAPDAQPPAAGQEAVYDVEIILDQTFIRAGDKILALSAGQTASAEIVIRQRRVVDFFLDPFKRLNKDGMTL
jgi:hemolysin D